MGFFAAELQELLIKYAPVAPWDVLARAGIHPMQIKRLQVAAVETGQVATLMGASLAEVRQSLTLTPLDYCRLIAGIEADTFFRLLVYHNYPLEEAANKSNAVFASALKDRLATGGNSLSIYPLIDNRPYVSSSIKPRRRNPRPAKPAKQSDGQRYP